MNIIACGLIRFDQFFYHDATMPTVIWVYLKSNLVKIILLYIFNNILEEFFIKLELS